MLNGSGAIGEGTANVSPEMGAAGKGKIQKRWPQKTTVGAPDWLAPTVITQQQSGEQLLDGKKVDVWLVARKRNLSRIMWSRLLRVAPMT